MSNKRKDFYMFQQYQLELEQECPYGFNEEEDKQTLVDICESSVTDYNRELIARAFDLCLMAHRHVKRASGIPYYTHPLKVAISLIKEFGYADNDTIAAALLHDVVEDSDDYSLEYIREQFGENVAKIVDGVTKIKGIKTRKLDKAATYAKLFETLVEDVRVMLIKLSDRLDNMRTLTHLPMIKQQAIADETLNFYTPFAQRLGLIKIKRPLEILSFYFKDPDAYENIRIELDKKRMELIKYIQKFHDSISQNLSKKDIPHIITIEHKHPYEIYKKAKEKNVKVSEIEDFYSMVVVLRTEDITECYKAYGVIANIFGPVSSLVDYIARPKINFYRALHSTHFGPDRRLVDVIIRTEEMDQIAEGGIAAIYKIKEGHSAFSNGNEDMHRFQEDDVNNWLRWMKDIIQDGDEDAIQKIWGSIRMNQYEKEITVYSANMDLRLPKGACPIDLAFSISDELGLHCISCKVNGEIKALNYELKHHDQVEIITSPNSIPLPEWQNWVITHKAIVKLYDYFKAEDEHVKIKAEDETEPKIIKFRIVGQDRSGMLKEITEAIGQINIMRINLSLNNNASFEGAFTLIIPDNMNPNLIYTKLISIKGVKIVEQLPEDEILI